MHFSPMPSTHSSVILGAGIQGCCIALELARRGQRVVLLDQDREPINRASLRNEGKIHLGLVYANEPSRKTADLMLEGALHFYPLLSRWLGRTIDQLQSSTPFYYLVADDSLLNPDELERHYHHVEITYRRLLSENPQLNYVGLRPDRLFHRLPADELARHFNSSRVQGGFITEERALDTREVAHVLRQAIKGEPNITFIPLHTVTSVSRSTNGFDLEGENIDGRWTMKAEQVVNATWESRQAIDLTMGITPEPNSLHRLKYRVLARLPDHLHTAPSVTMVIGRYGDVVIRPDHTVYLSWYPAAMKGWSQELQPPASWNEAITGQVEPSIAKAISQEIIQAIETWYPGIAEAMPYQTDGGIIFAHGQTDVDDTTSGLHTRAEVGVKSYAGYHSVSTGKYTTAPLFADQAANAVMAGGNR
jgi:glycine/D-amino acid oxidase-like deaminating enzyme